MEESVAAGGGRDGGADPEASQAERVRVTDRRRISLDEAAEAKTAAVADEAPRLKPTYVEELEARARAAEQKAADVQSRFEQLRADLRRETDETRQRLARAADERAARGQAALVGSLLPVVDNLRRAISAAEGGGALDALLGGLRGTVSGFENVLSGIGVEAVDAVGQQFDPALHEAVDTVEVEPARDGQVTAQYDRGYRVGAQLIRPARVQVGRARAAEESATRAG